MKLYISMSPYLIQQIRLIHAITETPYEIVLPPDEAKKYEPLVSRFSMRFTEGDNGVVDLGEYITIDHAEPITGIGDLRRPLIFPHSITQYCRSLWGERKYRFSFAGLITEKRKVLLDHWTQKNIGNKKKNRYVEKVENKLFALLGMKHKLDQKKMESLVVWQSDRGRAFPIKSWDDDYYRFLLNSQFVLCPSGDHVWSYRFFESILCGAIPVVEESCRAYQGFRYHTMQESAKKLVWSEDVAIYNYSLCLDRITVPVEVLSQELSKIIGELEKDRMRP